MTSRLRTATLRRSPTQRSGVISRFARQRNRVILEAFGAPAPVFFQKPPQTRHHSCVLPTGEAGREPFSSRHSARTLTTEFVMKRPIAINALLILALATPAFASDKPRPGGFTPKPAAGLPGVVGGTTPKLVI